MALLRLLRRLELRLFGDVPDPAWKAQTPVVKFAGFDAELQRRATLAADARDRPGPRVTPTRPRILARSDLRGR